MGGTNSIDYGLAYFISTSGVQGTTIYPRPTLVLVGLPVPNVRGPWPRLGFKGYPKVVLLSELWKTMIFKKSHKYVRYGTQPTLYGSQPRLV